MDRRFVYNGEVFSDVDILQLQKNALYGLSRLTEAILGTSPLVVGLQVVPTNPNTLNVNVMPGQIYQLASVDATPFSDLTADTTQVMQQGLSQNTLQFAITPPNTANTAQYYLVEAQFLQQDANYSVLQYFNSSNPPTSYATPYFGPGGNGAAQPLDRLGTVNIQLKAGTVAPTGNEQKPSLDSGFQPLAYVHVVYGQTSIRLSDITDVRPTFPNLLAHEAGTVATGVHGFSGSINATTLQGHPASDFMLQGQVNLTNVMFLSGNQTVSGLDTFSGGIASSYVQYLSQSSDYANALVGSVWYNSANSHLRAQLPSGIASILTTADGGSGGIIDASTLDGLTASQIESAVTSTLQPQLNNTLSFSRFAVQTFSTSSNGIMSFTFGFSPRQAIVGLTVVNTPYGEAQLAEATLSSISGNTVYVLTNVPGGGGSIGGFVAAFG